MEENEIKELFARFEPEMAPDFEFMNRLEQNLDSVELIRQRSAQLRARSRRALHIAACAGFLVGVLTTLAIPHIAALLAALHLPFQPLLPWLTVAAFTALTALTTYDLTVGSPTRC